MALMNFPQAPTVSSVYAPKDSVAQLNYMNQSNSQALNNLLKLGSQIHDYSLSREQAGLMENQNVDPNTKATQIAALESRKINSSDPSMVWRWKEQMDQQAAEAEKNRQASKVANKAISEKDLKDFESDSEMLLNIAVPEGDYAENVKLRDRLYEAIRRGKRLGADTSKLEERYNKLNTSPLDELSERVEYIIDSKNNTSSEEAQKFLDENRDELKGSQIRRLETYINIAKEREEKEYENKVLKKAKSLNTSGLDWEDLNEETKKDLIKKAKSTLIK